MRVLRLQRTSVTRFLCLCGGFRRFFALASASTLLSRTAKSAEMPLFHFSKKTVAFFLRFSKLDLANACFHGGRMRVAAVPRTVTPISAFTFG